MTLAASIVTYRTPADELAAVLDMLEASAVERVYVVDNASEARIKAICTRFGKVEYIASANRGYGAGHNKALRKSLDNGTKYHIVLNSDIAFRSEDVTTLRDYADSRPDVGCVHPRIVGPDGELQYTVRMLPTPLDLIGRRFLPRRLLARRLDRYELRHIDHSRPFDVPYHQGSFMFLRVEALRRVGLFDERFFMYPEDIDLTRRIHRHYLTMYQPEVTVVHNHRQASYHSRRMLWVHCRNMIGYFNKWGWLFDAERRRLNAPLRGERR